MNDARSMTRGQLMLAAVFLACGLALPFGVAAAPDYTLIPKLQEIKDHPAAPDFTLPDGGGKSRSLKDYRGKVVFLAFWATWCPYCREEIPAMESVYKDYKGKGFEVVAVAIKDKREDTLAFMKKNKLTHTVLMDPGGDIGSLYGAYITPTVYLIDRNGQVLARMWGPAGWGSPASRKLIAQLVEEM